MLIKQNILVQIICVLSISMASIGCETTVEVDIPEHTPVLVANSFFGADNNWEVQLFKSKSILDSGSFEIISDATVEILEEDAVVASPIHIENGIYRQDYGSRPEIGRTYKLRAFAPGFTQIEATDYVPVPVQIESVDADLTTNPSILTIHFSDPPGIKNYYQILILEESYGQIYTIFFETDDLISQDLDGLDAENAIFNDSLISGQEYNLRLRFYPFPPIDQIHVFLISVTESYYMYLKSIEDLDNDNPFAEPVQAYNNIENGLGIFAGFSASTFQLFSYPSGQSGNTDVSASNIARTDVRHSTSTAFDEIRPFWSRDGSQILGVFSEDNK